MNPLWLDVQVTPVLPDPASNSMTGPFVPKHSRYRECPPTSYFAARSGSTGPDFDVALATADALGGVDRVVVAASLGDATARPPQLATMTANSKATIDRGTRRPSGLRYSRSRT
jgi:hypothetical protein